MNKNRNINRNRHQNRNRRAVGLEDHAHLIVAKNKKINNRIYRVYIPDTVLAVGCIASSSVHHYWFTMMLLVQRDAVIIFSISFILFLFLRYI